MKLVTPASYDPSHVHAFVERWRSSNASERANSQSFIGELTDVLGVDRPRPKVGDPVKDIYCFEREVKVVHPDGHSSTNFIDLYKRGHFVFESKQGSEARAGEATILPEKAKAKRGTAQRGTGGYDLAMQSAYVQAERYARALDEWPPFLVVCDIGYSFELYACFDGSGKYQHFPAPGPHRVMFDRLVEPEVFTLLHAIFTAPASLDPARESAKVTREIAGHLASLAQSLEGAGHEPERVAKFLMRCLFTMFAEDVAMLPAAPDGRGLFTHAIEEHWLEAPARFVGEIEALWRAMNAGGSVFGVAGKILQFNGGLFADPTALPLTRAQLDVLLAAAKTDWSSVEPAIFGTLIERALSPKERHRLGAHFTPRAYVERLVTATVEEPLRADWDIVRAQVRQLVVAGKKDEAVKVLRGFHKNLVATRVLDPACGSGNFLYVTLDLFKRLEAEVLSELADLRQSGLLELETVTVNPGQFLGIEVKPWAREIADLVLWIGYLQWHHRTRGKVQPAEPVLREYKNIECRDALITWERTEPVLDEHGKPVTRWDGETMKVSPVTGEEIPDETARVPVMRYVGVKRAEWPQADFIVGNPPFIGNKRMRAALGDGYVEAVRRAHDDVPETVDFVMYWWHHAAELVRDGKARRFGLITTNSITQTFNRKIVQQMLDGKPPISIAFAIPDHPWVDSVDGAAVRISMTSAVAGHSVGTQLDVLAENELESGESLVTFSARVGVIHEDLTAGADVASAAALRANTGVCFQGPILVGEGFRVSSEDLLRLGIDEGKLPTVIAPYLIGRDLMQRPEKRYVIDFFGLTAEEAQRAWPKLYQHLLVTVKPLRDQVARKNHRERWWIFGEPRPGLRKATSAIARTIVTNFAAKHRVFSFQPARALMDHNIYVIAIDDPFHLGVLSSRVHVTWMLAAGSTLEDRPLWINSRCFLPFAFPAPPEAIYTRIRSLADALDAHRKKQQAAHPELTMTGMYNVLAKLRSGEALTAKDKAIHEQGLVSVLKQLHDDLDAAVFDAYGWPRDLTDEQILERLVALNAERAAEEARGLIRWLRPEFQNPSGKQAATQTTIAEPDDDEAAPSPKAKPAKDGRTAWPKEVPAQLTAIRALFTTAKASLSADAVCEAFKSARRAAVEQHLESLTSLGLLVRYDVGGAPHWHA